MKKIKKFIEEHRKEIVIGSFVAGAVIGGLVMRERMLARGIQVPKGCEMIVWDPTKGEPFSFERVKSLMDTLKDSARPYAVVRENEKYSLILLTDMRLK